MQNLRIQASKLLLVEGKDEQQFFSALFQRASLGGIQVVPLEGKSSLTRKLEAIKATPGFDQVVSLGLIRDGDDDPPTAFQSVRSSLRAVRLPVPNTLGVPLGSNPRVSVMILPDGTRQGMLEDLCLDSVLGEPVMQCVNQYFACVREQAGMLPRLLAKAKVHTFLASRPEPGKRLGEAAAIGYWPLGHSAFTGITHFLRSL